MSKVSVLRLDHRIGRDARISSHVALVARAFGAKKIIYSGEYDEKMMESIRDVAKRWGGKFEVKYEEKWKTVVKKFNGIKVHLTVYGLPIQKKINAIRKKAGRKNLLIVVGGAKVPGEIYGLVDYNVSVTAQPHSEVAALAIFLHEFYKGKELDLTFKGAELKVLPSEKGKNVVR